MPKNVKEPTNKSNITSQREKGMTKISEVTEDSIVAHSSPGRAQLKGQNFNKEFPIRECAYQPTQNDSMKNSSNSKLNMLGRPQGKMQDGLTVPGPSTPPQKLPKEDNSQVQKYSKIRKKFKDDGISPLKKKSERFPRARYICKLCVYHCDTIDICEKHILDSRHKYLKEAKLLEKNLSTLLPPTQPQYEVITELLEKIALQQGITASEIDDRIQIKEELEKRLQEIVPDSILKVTGSTLSGLAIKSSNLDLEVILPETEKRSAGLLGIEKIVKADTDTFRDISNDIWNSYPCMTFSHKKSGVRVVAGVPSPASWNTNILLGHYNSLDERVKKLVTVFKVWAKMCQIDCQQMGSLSSHCLTIMVIHFLQQTNPPVLPVLHELIDSDNSEVYKNPNDMEPPWKSKDAFSLGELWVKMFQYYAVDFKTSVHVINLRHSKPFVRTEGRWGKKMGIEDPFLVKRNMTHTVSCNQVFEYIAGRFKTTYWYFVIPQMSFGSLFKHLEQKPEPLFTEEDAKKNGIESTDLDGEDLAAAEKSFDGNDPSSEEEEDVDDDGVIDEDQEAADEADLKNEVEMCDEIMKMAITSSPEEEEDQKASMGYLDQSLTNGLTPLSDAIPSDEIELKEIEKLNVSDLKASLGVISKALAKHLMAQITKEMLLYSFDESNFTDRKTLPLHCMVCQKPGHTKMTCTTDDLLPQLKPLPPLTPFYINLISSMFYQLTNECAPQKKEVFERDLIVRGLEMYIKQFFPNAVLKLFGSSANGFGFGNSDLDICLTFQGSATTEGIDSIKVIEEISQKLKKAKEYRHVLAITTAKVPIVKLTLKRAKLEADLSLYNTLALQNTKLLYTYSTIDNRVKVLGYTLKYFAKLCDIGDAARGSLSSYAYILMVLHFLQRCNPPVIPVLQTLYDPNQPQPQLIIDGWNAWFQEDLSKLPRLWKDYGKNNKNVGELWVEMLRYFTETFNWRKNVVTIRQIEPLSKFEKLWTTKCIAIEDPFDLSHNLGGGLSRKMNAFILKAFIRGREVFGACPAILPLGYPNLGAYLFDKRLLTDGSPPNDRGCRCCGRIGHVIKECPRKLERKERQKLERQKKKETAGAVSKESRDAAKSNSEDGPKPIPVPPPPKTTGATSTPTLPQCDQGSGPKDEGEKDLMKDVTAHWTPPTKCDLDTNNEDSIGAYNKQSRKTSECKGSSLSMDHPSSLESAFPPSVAPRIPLTVPQETPEISPNLLFQLAAKLGGGAMVLPSAAHLPTSLNKKPTVPLPPPGFAAQPPPGALSSSSAPTTHPDARGISLTYGHQSTSALTYDPNTGSQEQVDASQSQLRHLQQAQLLQAHQLQLLQLQQSRQQVLQQHHLPYPPLHFQQQTHRPSQPIHLQQAQIQQLQQSRPQQQPLKQSQHHQPQSRPQQDQQQPMPSSPISQSSLPFQGRMPVHLDGNAFISHMAGIASQSSAQQNSPPGLWSSSFWMNPPGLATTPIGYSSPLQDCSNRSFRALHLPQTQPRLQNSNLQQNSPASLSNPGVSPFNDKGSKDSPPTTQSPLFDPASFGLANLQQQHQLNESQQQFTSVCGTIASPPSNVLTSDKEVGGNFPKRFSQ